MAHTLMPLSHRLSPAFLVLSFMLIARTNSQAKSSAATALRKTVDQANQTFVTALKHHDAHAMAVFFLADGIDAGNVAASGRAAIERRYKALVASTSIVGGSCTTHRLKRTGDLVCEIGSCTYRRTTARGVVTGPPLTFLTIWRFVGDKWGVAVNMPGP